MPKRRNQPYACTQRLHTESLELNKNSNIWITSLQTQIFNINSITIDWENNVELVRKDKDLQRPRDEKVYGIPIIYFEVNSICIILNIYIFI